MNSQNSQMHEMRRLPAARWARLFSRAVFFLACPALSAQLPPKAGDTVSVIPEASHRTPTQARDFLPLEVDDPVRVGDELKTERESELSILLLNRHQFTLGADVTASLQVQQGNDSVIVLVVGTIRVVSSGRPQSTIVVKTPTGQIVARNTGFIVSCPPAPPEGSGICTFVGLYSESEVLSIAQPDLQPVILQPQFYTELGIGQAPTHPQRMSDARFQQLIEATTILGTGAASDRLASTDASAGELDRAAASNAAQRNGSTPEIGRIPDQPLDEFEPLPLPPPPPQRPPEVREKRK